MSGDDKFRCDFCGQLTDLDDNQTFFRFVDELPDGIRLWIPAVYCSAYCGRTATSHAGTGRG